MTKGGGDRVFKHLVVSAFVAFLNKVSILWVSYQCAEPLVKLKRKEWQRIGGEAERRRGKEGGGGEKSHEKQPERRMHESI